MQEKINFRPHHFICVLGYQGKGYSGGFVENMDKVVTNGLHGVGGDDTLIEVVMTADVICAPCPHKRGEGCVKQAKIDALDERHAERLNLKSGEVLSWKAAKARIKTHVAKDDLNRLCAGCEWLDSGICKTALARLIDA